MKLDHVSCVVLGHFNPAILTPKFLTEKCGIPGAKDKLGSGQYSRLASQVQYNGVEFLALPDRLQVNESGIEKYESSKVCKYTLDYLACLEYTPVAAAGVNFNFTGIEKHLNILQDGKRVSRIKSLKLETAEWNCKVSVGKSGKEEIDQFGIKGQDGNYRTQIEWNSDVSRLNINFEQKYSKMPVRPDTILDVYASAPELKKFLTSFETLCDKCKEVLGIIAKE